MYAPNTNQGHGHVWPRPDGVKMRCGGPGLCRECSGDQSDKLKSECTTTLEVQPDGSLKCPTCGHVVTKSK